MTLADIISEVRILAGLEEGKPPDLNKLIDALAKSYGGPGPVEGADFMPSTTPIGRAGKVDTKGSTKGVKVKPKMPIKRGSGRRTTRTFTK